MPWGFSAASLTPNVTKKHTKKASEFLSTCSLWAQSKQWESGKPLRKCYTPSLLVIKQLSSSAPQSLTLLPPNCFCLFALVFFIPLLIYSNSFSTVQPVPPFAQYFLHGSISIATPIPVVPNCHNFQILHTYYKSYFLSPSLFNHPKDTCFIVLVM